MGAKWTGGMAQAVEYLLCKHKALSSNPTPTKQTRKKTTKGAPSRKRQVHVRV
jgi:hypothetical protein